MMYDNIENKGLFKGLFKKDLEMLNSVKLLNFKSFKKGEYIFCDEDEVDNIYILLSGNVMLLKEQADGKRNILAFLNEEGSIFAEVYAFLENRKIEISALCEADADILMLNRCIFKGNNNKVFDILRYNMLEILANKAYFLNKKLRLVTSLSLRQKLARLILDGSLVNISREKMADYIGATRPSISRELMKMQEEGLIIVDNKDIIIKNIEALKYESI